LYLYGAGGHSKVIAEILESMGKTIYGIFDDNVEEIRGQRSKRDDFGRKYLPVLESPVIIGNNNERAEIAELLTNSFDVKFGRLFIQPPLFRLVHQFDV
jgi:acetyltransferase EpsM